jgi:ribulose-phosphate 3-epimerase
MVVKIAPSILSADFTCLEKEIKSVEKAGADLIHIDVMDGHFVPNITMGPLVVAAVRKCSKLPLDVHLMIENPDKYIAAFAKAGADIITIQVEASTDIARDLKMIEDNKVKAGLVVNPATPIEKVFPYLQQISMVLVMSVNPGFEGQAFMPEVLGKIRALNTELRAQNTDIDIEVDGGINQETAKLAIQAGTNVLVAGSAVFYSKDYKQAINSLK